MTPKKAVKMMLEGNAVRIEGASTIYKKRKAKIYNDKARFEVWFKYPGYQWQKHGLLRDFEIEFQGCNFEIVYNQ